MATEPLLAVLLLGELGFPPWQYGLAFAVPCVGGLIGSRLARRVVARYGQHRVIRTVGTLRAVWLIGLAFVRPGVAGLVTVIAVELAIIISMSLYNPVLATYRLEHTPQDRVARTLSAWSISSRLHRHPHRARRAARRRHQPTHGHHGRGTAHPRQPAPASPTGPDVAARAGTVPQPLMRHRNSPLKPAALSRSTGARPRRPGTPPVKENTRVSTAPALDPTHTALLVMDYQPAILAFVPEDGDSAAQVQSVTGVGLSCLVGWAASTPRSGYIGNAGYRL